MAVFEADGRFVRTVGRRGRGPGEFAAIDDFQFDRNDTLFVLHDASISVFAPQTLEYVRSSSSRAATMAGQIAVLANGRLVTGRTGWRDRGPPEALLWIHSSDSSEPTPGGLVTLDTTSRAIFTRNDTIWLLRFDYQLFRQAGSGEWTLVAEPPQWFADDVRAAPGEDRRAPFVNDLAVSSDGRVWILSYVFNRADSEPTYRGGEGQERMMSNADFWSIARPVLDVWNADGTLYASVVLPKGIAGFVDAHRLVEVTDDAAGNPVISVREFRLQEH